MQNRSDEQGAPYPKPVGPTAAGKAQSRGQLVFPIPDGSNSSTEVSLFLQDLLVNSATLIEWGGGKAVPKFIKPAECNSRDRLISACKLKIQQDGAGFFNGSYQLRLEIGGGTVRVVVKQELQGLALLELLDVYVDQTDSRLADGAPGSERRASNETSVIAFYLPQFYPFPENDLWWGEGFTEWSNVVDAEQQIERHVMPLWPADLGFYDLRVEDTRRRQAQLAREYGIDGFCYYFYWFSGKRLMQDVLDKILSSGEPSTDFCLCWANESWSRRWDGTEGSADLLIGQRHNPDVDIQIISDLLPYFLDKRYIKIDGSPVILIYRLDIMTDVARVVAGWRRAARAAGFPNLFIAAVRSFGLTDEAAADVDAIVDFPPHTAVSTEIQDGMDKSENFSGKVYDYRQVVIEATTRKSSNKLTFPGVMPRWDNTARKGNQSHIFVNSTPSAFKMWTTFALQQSQQLPLGKRFVFINSWNEWGEGAMLEPDRHFGRSYLEALRSARGGYVLGPSDISKFALVSNLPYAGAEETLRNFSGEVQMVAQIMSWQRARTNDAFRVGMPEIVDLSPQPPIRREGMMIFDHSSSRIEADVIKFRYGEPISLVGWTMMDKSSPHVWERVGYIVLTSTIDKGRCYHVPVSKWEARPDVNAYYKMGLEVSECYFGFSVVVSTDNIVPGVYKATMIQAIGGELLLSECYTELEKLFS